MDCIATILVPKQNKICSHSFIVSRGYVEFAQKWKLTPRGEKFYCSYPLKLKGKLNHNTYRCTDFLQDKSYVTDRLGQKNKYIASDKHFIRLTEQ